MSTKSIEHRFEQFEQLIKEFIEKAEKTGLDFILHCSARGDFDTCSNTLQIRKASSKLDDTRNKLLLVSNTINELLDMPESVMKMVFTVISSGEQKEKDMIQRLKKVINSIT